MPSYSTAIKVGGQDVRTLRDVLPESHGLRGLFVGKTPTPVSVAAGHYFQGRQGRMFWSMLQTYDILRARTEYEDDSLLSHGFGVTDISKIPRKYGQEPSEHEYREGSERILALVYAHKPLVIVFIYKRVLDKILELRFGVAKKSRYGFNDELDKLFSCMVFVIPMPGTPCKATDAHSAMLSLEALFRKNNRDNSGL